MWKNQHFYTLLCLNILMCPKITRVHLMKDKRQVWLGRRCIQGINEILMKAHVHHVFGSSLCAYDSVFNLLCDNVNAGEISEKIQVIMQESLLNQE